MKKLSDLNPTFVGVKREGSGEGLEFDCPACGSRHRLAAYFVNPVDGGDYLPRGANRMWTRYGDSLADIVLSPSINYRCWHGWVEKGLVFDASESPVVVPMTSADGEVVKHVALSPMQALDYGNAIASTAMLLLQGKPGVGRVEVRLP